MMTITVDGNCGRHDRSGRQSDEEGGLRFWREHVVGLFEPVSTHPDFQGKGLGKAVMAEGLRRMKAAGMSTAVVGFDPNNAATLALYTSMDFRASCYFSFPRKELPG